MAGGPRGRVLYREEFEHAVRQCWELRKEYGVQGNKHLDPLATVVRDIFVDAGFSPNDVQTKRRLRLPGFYRSTKEWDVVVTYRPPRSRASVLAAAIEFKAQSGSVGKNMNNRIEEALGSAYDLRTAHRAGLFSSQNDPRRNHQHDAQKALFSGERTDQDSVEPWVGYFFLLAEDDESRHKPKTTSQFGSDQAFTGITYRDRYGVFCERLLDSKLYDAVCFVTSSSTDADSSIRELPRLGFDDFGEAVKKRAEALLKDAPYPALAARENRSRIDDQDRRFPGARPKDGTKRAAETAGQRVHEPHEQFVQDALPIAGS
jgi:hypothetical protein